MGAKALRQLEEVEVLQAPTLSPASRYLFADSEPFEHNFDFISVLQGFVQLAATVLKHAREVKGFELDLARARGELAQQFSVLDQLEHEVLSAAASVVNAAEAEAFMARAAARLDQVVRELCGANRGELEAMFDGHRGELARTTKLVHTQMVSAMKSFLLSHQLEQVAQQVTVELTDQGYKTLLTQHLAGDISVGYELDETRTFWSEPRRMADLISDLTLEVGMRRSWFTRALTMESRPLQDYVIGAVRLEGDVADISLRKKRDSQDCLSIHLIRTPQGLAAQVVRSEDPTEIFDAPSEAAPKLERLWNALAQSCRVTVAARARVTALLIRGENALHAVGSELLVDQLVSVYRPIVAQVMAHGRSAHELALKWDVGDGRREERFVSLAALFQPVTALLPEDRARLAGLGFEALPFNVRVLEPVVPLLNGRRSSLPPLPSGLSGQGPENDLSEIELVEQS
jgi:hypothetical protein